MHNLLGSAIVFLFNIITQTANSPRNAREVSDAFDLHDANLMQYTFLFKFKLEASWTKYQAD